MGPVLGPHFLDGQPLLRFQYWDEGDYGDDAPPLDLPLAVAGRVQSRFFTMDVARTRRGDWMIVELGDGQVAGLPEGVDPGNLFRGLRAHLTRP